MHVPPQRRVGHLKIEAALEARDWVTQSEQKAPHSRTIQTLKIVLMRMVRINRERTKSIEQGGTPGMRWSEVGASVYAAPTSVLPL